MLMAIDLAKVMHAWTMGVSVASLKIYDRGRLNKSAMLASKIYVAFLTIGVSSFLSVY